MEGTDNFESPMISIAELHHNKIKFKVNTNSETLNTCVKNNERSQFWALDGRGKVTDENLAQFLHSGQFFKGQTSINLNFFGSNDLTDTGLKTLSKGLKRLTALKRIYLDFTCCSNITDKGMLSLGESLRGLTSLQKVDLNFSWCKKITDKGIQRLTKGLKRLQFIEGLSLNFRECPQIEEECLESLSRDFRGMKCLRKLVLNFQECKKIKNSGLSQLSFERLPSLQSLYLNLA